MSDSTEPAEIQVSMPVVVKFIRQLAHDLRNHLNAAELQSAYLSEIAENEELRDEIKRLRSMVAQVGINLQQVTAALSQPPLTEMPYAAGEFIEDLQQKLATAFPAESAEVRWEIAGTDANLNIDPQLLLPALVELFANAFRHEPAGGPITASARAEKGRFVFTLSEPKRSFQRSTENWGREPLQSPGQGHYGLGLYRTRRIIEAHGGELVAQYHPGASTLVTTVSLPLAPASEA
jgi:signal transduction histidine kinase